MCSIIGFKGKFDPALVSRLLDESRLRGIHSFGYTCGEGTFKYHDYEIFKNSILRRAPDVFIAHFRYSTSGDYKDLDNCQPLDDGKLSIAFNGVISQEPKEVIEQKFGVKLRSDNDGWVLSHFIGSKQRIGIKTANYACVYLREGNTLGALRNRNRPLYMSSLHGNTVIASTDDILIRSGINMTALMSPNKYYEW